MAERRSFIDPLFRWLLVGILILMAFLVFSETYPSERGAPQPSTPLPQDRAIPKRFEIVTDNGIATDLGPNGPRWIIAKDAVINFQNYLLHSIRKTIEVSLGVGVCKTARQITLTSDAFQETFMVTPGSESQFRFDIEVQPGDQSRLLLSIDGLPCLFAGDPRVFYGQVTTKIVSG